MKKIFLALLTLLLVGCSSQKEELINIGEVEGHKIYISTPSGAIYIASGSEIIAYRDKNGKQKI